MAKCKYCGSTDVYEGFSWVECATQGCDGFSEKHLETVNSRAIKSNNVAEIALEDDSLWPLTNAVSARLLRKAAAPVVSISQSIAGNAKVLHKQALSKVSALTPGISCSINSNYEVILGTNTIALYPKSDQYCMNDVFAERIVQRGSFSGQCHIHYNQSLTNKFNRISFEIDKVAMQLNLVVSACTLAFKCQQGFTSYFAFPKDIVAEVEGVFYGRPYNTDYAKALDALSFVKDEVSILHKNLTGVTYVW